MAKIESKKELEEFLKTRPREDAIAITARAALRVIPLLVNFDLKLVLNRRAFSSCLRASSVSWATVGMPSREIEIAARAAQSDSYTVYSSGIAAYAAYAARTAIRTALGYEYIAVSAADIVYASDDWPSLNADIAALRSGQRAQDLSLAPLWPEGIPPEMEGEWQRLKSTLLSFPDENWQVWTDWYEARLRGGPFNAELEKARAILPDELWKQGPKVVNAEIARLIEKYSTPALPPEKDAPIYFELRDGQIHSAPPPATQPTDPEVMASAWRGLRELLDDLLRDLGGNQPDLRRKLERYSRAMGDMFSALDLHRFGIHGDSLKHYSELAGQELMVSQAADLLALLAHHSIFLAHYQEWKNYLAAIDQPFADDKSEIKAVSDANLAFEEIKNASPELMADDAKTALGDLGELANEEKTPENRRSFLRGIRSLLSTMAGSALAQAVKKGFVAGVEKGVGEQTTAAIIAAGPFLLALASGIPLEFAWLAALVTYLKRISKSDGDKK